MSNLSTFLGLLVISWIVLLCYTILLYMYTWWIRFWTCGKEGMEWAKADSFWVWRIRELVMNNAGKPLQHAWWYIEEPRCIEPTTVRKTQRGLYTQTHSWSDFPFAIDFRILHVILHKTKILSFFFHLLCVNVIRRRRPPTCIVHKYPLMRMTGHASKSPPS